MHFYFVFFFLTNFTIISFFPQRTLFCFSFQFLNNQTNELKWLMYHDGFFCLCVLLHACILLNEKYSSHLVSKAMVMKQHSSEVSNINLVLPGFYPNSAKKTLKYDFLLHEMLNARNRIFRISLAVSSRNWNVRWGLNPNDLIFEMNTVFLHSIDLI